MEDLIIENVIYNKKFVNVDSLILNKDNIISKSSLIINFIKQNFASQSVKLEEINRSNLFLLLSIILKYSNSNTLNFKDFYSIYTNCYKYSTNFIVNQSYKLFFKNLFNNLLIKNSSLSKIAIEMFTFLENDFCKDIKNKSVLSIYKVVLIYYAYHLKDLKLINNLNINLIDSLYYSINKNNNNSSSYDDIYDQIMFYYYKGLIHLMLLEYNKSAFCFIVCIESYKALNSLNCKYRLIYFQIEAVKISCFLYYLVDNTLKDNIYQIINLFIKYNKGNNNINEINPYISIFKNYSNYINKSSLEELFNENSYIKDILSSNNKVS